MTVLKTSWHLLNISLPMGLVSEFWKYLMSFLDSPRNILSLEIPPNTLATLPNSPPVKIGITLKHLHRVSGPSQKPARTRRPPEEEKASALRVSRPEAKEVSDQKLQNKQNDLKNVNGFLLYIIDRWRA